MNSQSSAVIHLAIASKEPGPQKMCPPEHIFRAYRTYNTIHTNITDTPIQSHVESLKHSWK